MKKNYSYASLFMAAFLTFGLTSCGNKSAEKTEDTVVAVVEDTVEEAPVAESQNGVFDNAFFSDASRKSDVATDSTYVQTASGLRYAVEKEGTGESPKASDTVEVHYIGRLTDGTVFDSSVDRGQTATFPLQGVIKGWTEGLTYMKEGGKTVFYIPSDLGYGPTGTPGGPIPPNADLIFEVELIKVVK